MERRILIFRLLIILCFFYNFSTFAQEIIRGQAKIIDGDTVHIGKNKIRLHGIDAPEINQTCIIDGELWNCGIESKMALKKLISKKEINCEILDVDRYKRYVSECLVNNININKYMVQSGWAIAYRYYSIKFVEDEEIAKKQKLGIWKGTFIEPYLFRKKNK